MGSFDLAGANVFKRLRRQPNALRNGPQVPVGKCIPDLLYSQQCSSSVAFIP